MTSPTCTPAGICIFTSLDVPVGSCTEIIVDPLWYKDFKKKLRPDINCCACCLPEDASSERWKIDYLVRVYLALLVLAASGGDPSLGQEELAAGTDTDLIETLSISRNPSFAQGQARHAHGLSIQHQQSYSRLQDDIHIGRSFNVASQSFEMNSFWCVQTERTSRRLQPQVFEKFRPQQGNLN